MHPSLEARVIRQHPASGGWCRCVAGVEGGAVVGVTVEVCVCVWCHPPYTRMWVYCMWVCVCGNILRTHIQYTYIQCTHIQNIYPNYTLPRRYRAKHYNRILLEALVRLLGSVPDVTQGIGQFSLVRRGLSS